MHLIETLPPLEAFLWGALAMAAIALLIAFACALILWAWYRLTELSLDVDQLGNTRP